MNYTGLDLADKSSKICIIDESETILRRKSLPTTEEGLRQGVEGLLPMKVVIEASPLAEWAADVLEGIGCEVVIIDARAAKHLVSSKKKTDARDAHTMARMARSGWYTEVHRKSPEARQNRSRLQGRAALMRVKKSLGNSIRGLLKAQGVKLGKVSEGEFAERVLEIVRERFPDLLLTFEEMLKSWQHARQGSVQLEKEIAQTSREDTVLKRLKSVPGVGPLVSTAYIATIDEPSRFNTGGQVADYLGMAPRIYQSGESEYRGRITKEGDILLRWHLVEAANVLLTKGMDCALKRWGKRIEDRRGGAKARVAVARKLAILLWRLWKTGESFNPWPNGQPAEIAAS